MGKRVCLIFVGGAGRNVWKHMSHEPWPQGVARAVYVDSTPNALSPEERESFVQIGQVLLDGHGAVTPDRGRTAAESDAEALCPLWQGTDAVVIIGGLGGGLGTGAAPVIARLAHEMGLTVDAVMSTPFGFEGKQRIETAEGGVPMLRAAVDRLTLIDLDALHKARPELTLATAYETADRHVADAVKRVCWEPAAM